jgi:hypothetical protein
MRWILDQLFGKRLHEHTARYLEALRRAPMRASRSNATEFAASLGELSSHAIFLGESPSGEKVSIPMSDVLNSHAMVTGGTGSGETRFALLILKSVIGLLPGDRTVGCCVLDPKGETFAGALYLLKQRIGELGKAEARELRRRIVVIDFSLRDPVSSYNILARWPNAEADFFAGSRADLLLDLLPGSDALSLGGSALLRKAILLLSEFGLPIGWLDELLFDDALRSRLLARSANTDLVAYFTRQFPNVPKQTIAALSRRMEALFSSDALRCVLSGRAAPDFRALQDEGKVVLINCAGANLSRGVRRLLQALVVSDFCQAVFSRERRSTPFLFVPDEAQNFFITERLRDQMTDFLCMSRSFGVHGLFLTQSITAAVQDSRVLNTLRTNVRWSFAMRGEPSDAAHLKGALPVTGRKARTRTSPFEEPSFHTLSEERSIALEGVANLPDRMGYLWLKSRALGAFLMRTADLDLPIASELEQEILALRCDPTFGMRQSRKEYDFTAEQRNREWRAETSTSSDLSVTLTGAYRRIRGEEP